MAIPEDIKPIWDLLYDETVAVHAYWILFEQLFGGSQDQLDLLNRSAGFCFYVIQDALATDVQLSLSKLSDPAESNRKTNATTQHLLNEVRALNWPAPVGELHRLWQSFIDSCEPIRLSRNKMIAARAEMISFRYYGWPNATRRCKANERFHGMTRRRTSALAPPWLSPLSSPSRAA